MVDDWDEEIFTNNEDVTAGDNCIIFKTKNGEKVAVTKGIQPRGGDKVIVHHTSDGDLITHGKSRIGVGDTVVVVPGEDGDLYGLKGWINPMRDCQLIHHRRFNSNGDSTIYPGRYYYKKSVFDLERPTERLPDGGWPRINLRLDFAITNREIGNDFGDMWYPYGGVWVGVSENGEDYWWCGGTGSPYATIAGPPMWHRGEEGMVQLCIEHWLGGCPLCCPPPFDTINYIQVHLHTTSSLYFKRPTVDSTLLYLTICEGFIRDGFCRDLADFGIRDLL